MDEKKLSQLMSLQKHLSEVFEEEAGIIRGEGFNSLDGFNKDLMVTEANAIQTLLGLISIRIGFGISAVQQARKQATENSDTEEKQPADEKETTEEAPQSE